MEDILKKKDLRLYWQILESFLQICIEGAHPRRHNSPSWSSFFMSSNAVSERWPNLQKYAQEAFEELRKSLNRSDIVEITNYLCKFDGCNLSTLKKARFAYLKDQRVNVLHGSASDVDAAALANACSNWYYVPFWEDLYNFEKAVREYGASTTSAGENVRDLASSLPSVPPSQESILPTTMASSPTGPNGPLTPQLPEQLPSSMPSLSTVTVSTTASNPSSQSEREVKDERHTSVAACLTSRMDSSTAVRRKKTRADVAKQVALKRQKVEDYVPMVDVVTCRKKENGSSVCHTALVLGKNEEDSTWNLLTKDPNNEFQMEKVDINVWKKEDDPFLVELEKGDSLGGLEDKVLSKFMSELTGALKPYITDGQKKTYQKDFKEKWWRDGHIIRKPPGLMLDTAFARNMIKIRTQGWKWMTRFWNKSSLRRVKNLPRGLETSGTVYATLNWFKGNDDLNLDEVFQNAVESVKEEEQA
jgi:hypothetical protein